MLTVHPNAESISSAQGITPAQFKAGLNMVKQALNGNGACSVSRISQTEKQWLRVKAQKSNIRAIVSVPDENTVVLIAVLPRDSHTYDTVEQLHRAGV
jgi:hypothetical protein